MRGAIGPILASSLLLSACHSFPGLGVGPKKPVTTAAVTASPSPASTQDLLSGVVKMDAHYVIAAGGGNIIAAGGGNVIAAGGGNVIAPGGGNIIAAGGGNVIAPGGGNVVPPGGANYHVTAAGARILASDVPVGTILPAKGMVVVPMSLVTGKPVADAVLTDEQGRYTLKLPAGLAENVYLVAAVPGKDANDPLLQNRRLAVNLVVSPRHLQDQTMDEDTAVVARYLRICLSNQLQTMFANYVGALSEDQLGIVPEQYRELIRAAKKAKVDTLPDYVDRQRYMADQITARLLAALDVDAVMMDGEKKPAIPALVELFRSVREATAKKLAEDKGFFARQSYIQDQAKFGCLYAIKRPTDLSEFMVKKYLAVGSAELAGQTDPVMASIGLPSQKDRLYKATKGILDAMLEKLNDKALNQAIAKMIESAPTVTVKLDPLDCDADTTAP